MTVISMLGGKYSLNDVNVKEEMKIGNRSQVILDSDLAMLYQCKNGTKSINLAVNRNKERFPKDFYFQLTKEEYDNLRFQFETANNMSRVLPYVFTEQGVAMLASVLKTEIASKVSVQIMRAFVSMRHYLHTNLLFQDSNLQRISNLETKSIEYDKEIKLLQNSFNQLSKNIKNTVCTIELPLSKARKERNLK